MSSAVCLLLSAHVCQFELELGRTRAYPMQTGGSGYSRVEYLHRRPHMGGGRGTSIHIPAPVAGLGLAAGASMLLWWNEKRTAETERMLREARAELSGRRRGGEGRGEVAGSSIGRERSTPPMASPTISSLRCIGALPSCDD